MNIDWNFYYILIFVWVMAAGSSAYMYDLAGIKERSVSRDLRLREVMDLMSSASACRQCATLLLMIVAGLSAVLFLITFTIVTGVH